MTSEAYKHWRPEWGEKASRGLMTYGSDGEPSHHDWKSDEFNSKILPRIKKYLKGNTLDVGCGNGRLSYLISQYADTVYGVDPFDSQMDKFKNAKITYETISLGDFSTEEKFDCIFFWGSFYLLHDPEHTLNPSYPSQQEYHILMLKKCGDILAEDGSIIIIDDPKRLVTDDEDHWGFYNLNSLSERSSLKIVEQFTQHGRMASTVSVIKK